MRVLPIQPTIRFVVVTQFSIFYKTTDIYKTLRCEGTKKRTEALSPKWRFALFVVLRRRLKQKTPPVMFAAVFLSCWASLGFRRTVRKASGVQRPKFELLWRDVPSCHSKLLRSRIRQFAHALDSTVLPDEVLLVQRTSSAIATSVWPRSGIVGATASVLQV